MADDDRITGQNIAFAGRAIADDPIKPLARETVPTASVMAPANSSDFIALTPTARFKRASAG
jgi:hypothetical protein